MTVVTITHEKYYEIYDELTRYIPDKNPYLFQRYLRCTPTLSKIRLGDRAMVDLTFENERDYIWFELKWL